MDGGDSVTGASLPQGKLQNTHYRVSAKALIVRDGGLVLCVKEGSDDYWSLPGGGIDFGESLQEALSRELREEVGFVGDFSMDILGTETFFAEKHDTWKMNIIVKIVPNNFNFSLGQDADEVAFKPPQAFADSSFLDERYIYKYGCEELVDGSVATTRNDNWIIQTMQQLNLPDTQYAVFGSGLLDVLGLKKANDIDLLVTKELFAVLEQEKEWVRFVYPDGYPGLKHVTYDVELFYQSDMPLCDLGEVERMICDAVEVQGVKFVQMNDILAWKKSLGREKDVRAVKLIEVYMKEQRS